MEIESTNSLAKMLWKCLFSLDNIMCSVTQQNITIENVTMPADTFPLLTPKLLYFLHQKGLLEITVAKLK